MTTTYIQRQVARTSRNLLVVNGIIILFLALFGFFMLAGAAVMRKDQNDAQARMDALSGNDVLGASAAVDLSHPTPLAAGEVGEQKLADLVGQVVTLTAPQAVDTHVFVARWSERATGKNKPKLPPSYFALQTKAAPAANGSAPSGPPLGSLPPGVLTPFGGPAFIIVPAQPVQPTRHAVPTFTGVVRPLSGTDRSQIDPMLSGQTSQPSLPYMLDCLDVGGRKTPVMPSAALPGGGFVAIPLFFLLMDAALIALPLWNVVKAARRLKNPALHPVYAQLARYGTPTDIERHIETDYQRGARRMPPADLTSMWLLSSSFWGMDVVPLSYIVWIYRPRKLAFRGNLLQMLLHSIVAAHTLIFLDRLGKQHAMRAPDGQLDQIMSAVTQGRPWMETGQKSPLRQQFGMDKAGFIAAVEARRQQMTAQPAGYAAPPTQPQWDNPANS